MPKIGTYIPKGDIPTQDKLRMIRDAGFDFVCFGYGRFSSGDVSPEMCAKYGLEFDNIHLSGDKTNFIWGKDEIGDEICERYCKEIRECSEAGIHKGIVHVTWGKSVIPDDPSDIGFARYTKIGETAAKYGFTVAVENSIFPEHFYSVLDRFTGPEFGHCFDCGHWNAFLHDYKIIEKYSDRLVATHIHDNDGERDLHMLPFDGSADWDDIAAKFAGAEFSRKMICSEFSGPQILKKPGVSAEKLNRIFSRLKIYGTDELSISDEEVRLYMNVPYDELMARLYERMKKLSDMIEEKAAKL